MPSCEKCWGDAYLRFRANPMKDQTEHYYDLLEERINNPCPPEEQAGQFWDKEKGCDIRLFDTGRGKGRKEIGID